MSRKIGSTSTPRGSNPGSAARRWRKLRTSRPEPASSTTASATCADDDGVAQGVTRRRGRRSYAARDVRRSTAARPAPCRRQARHDRRQHRHGGDEQQGALVECDLVESRKVGRHVAAGRAVQTTAISRRRDRRQIANSDDSIRNSRSNRADEAPSASRTAVSSDAIHPAHQRQQRDVRACDEKHQAHGGEQHPQHARACRRPSRRATS